MPQVPPSPGCGLWLLATGIKVSWLQGFVSPEAVFLSRASFFMCQMGGSYPDPVVLSPTFISVPS